MSRNHVPSQSFDTLCDRCLLLTFDPGASVDTHRPKEDYALVKLKYELNDQLPGLQELEKSIAQGCQMCSFLQQVIRSHGYSPAKLPQTAHFVSNITLSLFELHAKLPSVLFASAKRDWSLYRIDGEIRLGTKSEPISIHIKTRHAGQEFGFIRAFPEANMLSETSINRLRACLDACISNQDTQHDQCPRNSQTSAPSRLLDISNEKTIRLENTKGMDIRYAILSYCWGPSKIAFDARTVVGNLQLREAGFPVNSLPQTLQDSIALARLLGMSYIWIDALCIVQDSGEWVFESQRMMQYYEMASFTIVPVDCGGAEEGFLKPQKPWVSREIMWKGTEPLYLQFYYPGYKSLHEGSRLSPWNCRGWTLQERLLSSRMLIIGRYDILFRCRNGYTATGASSITSEKDGSTFLPASGFNLKSLSDWNTVDAIRRNWYEIMREYSARQLTKRSDKLIALAGLISKFKQFLDGDATHWDGFWKADLWHGLTWVEMGQGKKWPEKSDDFPSWSWCSMNKPVVWNDGTGSVNDAELVELIQDTKQGAIASLIMIVIKTWIFPIRVLESQIHKDIEISIRPDSDPDDHGDLIKRDDLQVILLTAYLDGETRDEWIQNPAAKPHDVCGMVIEPNGDFHGTSKMYRRLGVVNIMVGLDFVSVSSKDSHWSGYGKELSFVDISNFEESGVVEFYRQMYSRKDVVALF